MASAFIDLISIDGKENGPLNGLTFSVKDLFDIRGQATGFGNPTWLSTHPAATETCPAVQHLLDAGASVRGKTQMDELAYSLNGENLHYGTPANPAAPGRIPGGSSSGSASACAGDLCHFALGSDTGGSVRVPASYCGLYGFRPTWGRISLEGARPLAPSFDTVGLFSRNPDTLAQAMGVLLRESGDQRINVKLKRWLLARDTFALTEDSTSAALLKALALNIQDSTEIDISSGLDSVGLGSLRAWFNVFRVIQGHEIWAAHGEWVEQHRPVFGPGIKERFEMASRIRLSERDECSEKRKVITEHMLQILGQDGLLILPTTPGPAPLLNTPPASLDQWRTNLLSLTCIAGLAGLPQVTIPIAKVNGLPVGLSLLGPRGADEELLDVARWIKGLEI